VERIHSSNIAIQLQSRIDKGQHLPRSPLDKVGLRGVLPVDIELLSVPTPGQGTFIFLHSESENSFAGFTSLGERGKKAEAVGEEAAMEFLRYYSTDAALDSHISDQLVLYLSICEKESIFTTSSLTGHLMTNLWAIGLFHEFRYSIEGEIGKPIFAAGRLRLAKTL